jgi:hypothetical protein
VQSLFTVMKAVAKLKAIVKSARIRDGLKNVSMESSQQVQGSNHHLKSSIDIEPKIIKGDDQAKESIVCFVEKSVEEAIIHEQDVEHFKEPSILVPKESIKPPPKEESSFSMQKELTKKSQSKEQISKNIPTDRPKDVNKPVKEMAKKSIKSTKELGSKTLSDGKVPGRNSQKDSVVSSNTKKISK